MLQMRKLAPWLLLFGIAALHAEVPALNGSLGRWLDASAGPDIAKLYSRHPRFKGETVRFVTLEDGKPRGQTNELNRAIERHLTQQLLGVDGLRVAFDDAATGCRVPQAAGYLVGIEVEAVGGRSYQVNIGLIDVAESVWVSGLSLEWRGQLLAAERSALNRTISGAAPGSATSPLAITDADRIAKILTGRLRCALPSGIEGSVYVASPENPALTRISLALQSQLMVMPIAAVTPNAESASWHLTVESLGAAAQPAEPHAVGRSSSSRTARVEPGLSEVQLVLTRSDNSDTSQRLASVFVTGITRSVAGAKTAAADSGATQNTTTEPFHEPLLSSLQLHPARNDGICDSTRARVSSCTEIGFTLSEPAYLLTFATQQQHVNGVSCAARLERAQPGERQFRLRVPPTANGLNPATLRPDAGFYAVATKHRYPALQLDRLLKSAPGACRGTASPQSLAHWLTSVRQLVEDYDGQLEWRSVYLTHGPDGINQL